ncbi:protein translocase subunit SecF [Candidatus Palibaumannia cicadellinicola]|uniref:Protein-export membrane protein SecF n=1 Tax=Baumannia cicadellinicola subsp. Homalodisca coagulata TaxID=374463 RepID=Q1LSN7_BAUCH|nr:protein translocase subunit SecF [Candidatus Baumannia cicadellinicola]ABF14016.1 protein-export membrane protein SecF [Baumannia cicadellinicola str. Hc (Homalodisca coagulata)]MCJ7461942.1 protein translocase subunit SecF [Candidatus Baumannia cicadellinicola]
MTRKENSVVNKLESSIKVYDFMRWSFIAFSSSVILFLASIIVIFMQGFNWGLDFTGGTIVELHLEQTIDIDQIRKAIEQSGFKEAIVQNFGSSQDIIVRMPFMANNIERKITSVVNEVTQQNITVKRVEVVGPSVSNDLLQTGSIALLLAIICIFIYVIFRFEWRLATGTVLALIHDVVITLGLLSVFKIEIESTIIASLISVIGYSLNDSIVVSDRIRENFRVISSSNTYDLFNISITQVLNRTIITSVITMTVVLILIIFGGSMLRSFSITLFIGVLIGTISSIYVASALALKLGIKREHIIAS